MDSKIIFIVGATASGKSSSAISIAQKANGEIICADSQTIRKHLDIGTAKPTKKDQKLVKHHMLDIIEPYERYSVAEFKNDAENAIIAIASRGKLPIIVGGSGLYIDALYYDYSLSTEKSSEEKKELEKLSTEELQNIILKNKWELPKNKNNPRHLIGVILRNGESPKNLTPRRNSLIFGLKRNDDELKLRIDNRIEEMFKAGFINEVREVVELYGKPPSKLDAIGYPIIDRYISGEFSLEKAKQLFKTAHWQYARRQKTWFSRNKSIQWFGSEDTLVEAVLKEI